MPAFCESENEEAMSDAIDSYLLSRSRLSIFSSHLVTDRMCEYVCFSFVAHYYATPSFLYAH